MSIFTSDEPPTKKFKERGSKWGVVPAKEKNPMVDDFGEDIVDENAADNDTKKVIAQFASLEGDLAGPQIEVPINVTTEQLKELLNSLLNNSETQPYSFFVNEEEIIESLKATVEKLKADTESIVKIVYQPQAIFRVRAVTRCSATVPGHAEAVLSVHFSADGRHMVSGSGDATVRVWDVVTATPRLTLKGHTNWVLAVAFSPDLKLIVSGGMDSEIRIWDTATGKRVGKVMKGHKKWITGLAWKPYACSADASSVGRRLASSSKDGTIKVWDVDRKICVHTLSGHTNAVKAMRWGGTNLLYSASQDRTIKVWDPDKGILVRTLDGHGHWVNCLSLNTDHVLRAGPFDHKGERPKSDEDALQLCKKKYQDVLKGCGGKELLVSGSDDFTMFLWDPANGRKPIARLTGHQQPVNFVAFSPDGHTIASASFDGSVRMWNGATGKFIATLRGHVQAVYQVCWSADSRLLVSSSKDSTLKVWDLKTKKIKFDLPGHADEVYAVDWSPDGKKVASGGKDKVIKLWTQ